MAYTAHKWVDGELITAEKLNELEEAAAHAAQPGPPGVGLNGEAEEMTALALDADAAAVSEKVNEIVGVLLARGVSRAPGA